MYPSQLEVTYGGTAPVATKFWPPILPPITEEINEAELGLVPKKDYAKFIEKNR